MKAVTAEYAESTKTKRGERVFGSFGDRRQSRWSRLSLLQNRPGKAPRPARGSDLLNSLGIRGYSLRTLRALR